MTNTMTMIGFEASKQVLASVLKDLSFSNKEIMGGFKKVGHNKKGFNFEDIFS